MLEKIKIVCIEKQPKDRKKTMIDYTEKAPTKRKEISVLSQHDILLPSPIISSNQFQFNPGMEHKPIFEIHWAISTVTYFPQLWFFPS